MATAEPCMHRAVTAMFEESTFYDVCFLLTRYIFYSPWFPKGFTIICFEILLKISPSVFYCKSNHASKHRSSTWSFTFLYHLVCRYIISMWSNLCHLASPLFLKWPASPLFLGGIQFLGKFSVSWRLNYLSPLEASSAANYAEKKLPELSAFYAE